MPVRPPNPFADLEDTEFWERHGIQMRLRSHFKRNKWSMDFRPRPERIRVMSSFQEHGINHLSPSSVSMFTGSPTAWIARYLMGHRFSAGAAAWRGIAVEHGLAGYIFQGWSPEEAANEALIKFDELKGALNVQEDVERERKRIYRYIINGIDAIIEATTNLPIGTPQHPPLYSEKGQWSVGLPCRFGDHPKDKVEVIGYLDFLYANDENKFSIVDLKTTARIPSDWSNKAHAMQASFYRRAFFDKSQHKTLPDVYFMYVSPKEEGKPNPFNILKLDEETYERELKSMKDTITRMSKMLALSNNPFVLADAMPHDETSFYWTGEPSLSQIIEDAKSAIETTEEN